jgi:hypothetical protein
MTLLAMLLFGSSLSAGPQVPFGGTMNATQVSVQMVSTSPITLKFTYAFSGQASHLGQATGIAHAVVVPTVPATILSTDLTFTAANGDKVFGTFGWTFVPTKTPNILQPIIEYKLTGGTGRFVGATGGGTATGLFNSVTRQATCTFQGTISSPGALK